MAVNWPKPQVAYQTEIPSFKGLKNLEAVERKEERNLQILS